MPNQSNQTIVVRRRRKPENHAQHGGWKVAFADLMVALMCLFLVLWIIQILDSKDKQKIVQYFKDGTSSTTTHGYENGNSISPMVLPHVATSREDANLDRVEDKAVIEGEYNSEQELAVLVRKIKEKVQQLDASDSIKVTYLPQGVKLIISDSENGTMFYRSSSRITPYYEKLLLDLAPELKSIKNDMIITGHTDSSKFVGTKTTNWELSAERANIARYFLQLGGVPEESIFQVSGMADTAPLVKGEGFSDQNRRVELFLLTRMAEDELGDMYKKQPIDEEALKREIKRFRAEMNQSR